jgi:hypothetical protein
VPTAWLFPSQPYVVWFCLVCLPSSLSVRTSNVFSSDYDSKFDTRESAVRDSGSLFAAVSRKSWPRPAPVQKVRPSAAPPKVRRRCAARQMRAGLQELFRCQGGGCKSAIPIPAIDSSSANTSFTLTLLSLPPPGRCLLALRVVRCRSSIPEFRPPPRSTWSTQRSAPDALLI